MKADTLGAQAPTAAGGLAYSHPPVGDSAQRVTNQGLRLARFVASRRLVKPYSMGHVSGAAVSPLCRSPPPGDAPQCLEFDVLVCALASMSVVVAALVGVMRSQIVAVPA